MRPKSSLRETLSFEKGGAKNAPRFVALPSGRWWFGGQWVFGPGMSRVFAHQLSSDRGVVLGPKTSQIRGDLHCTLIWCQKMNHERQAATGKLRSIRHSKKVLQSRLDPRWLTGQVVNPGAAASRQDDVIGKLVAQQSL